MRMKLPMCWRLAGDAAVVSNYLNLQLAGGCNWLEACIVCVVQCSSPCHCYLFLAIEMSLKMALDLQWMFALMLLH